MAKYKVYISSTFLDMAPARKQILDTIFYRLKDWFEFTTVMEMMPGDIVNRLDIDTCIANVKAANIYILLLGKRYGAAPERYSKDGAEIIQNNEGKSYTWLEYETAFEIKEFRRLHIYKLELTDEFFETEKIELHSDLDDEKKRERFGQFNLELNNTGSSVKVNSLSKLGDQLFLMLTKSFLEFNSITQLDINDEERWSIDRKSQIDFLLTKNLDPQSRVASLVVNLKNADEDDVETFSKKIRQIFLPDEYDEVKRNLKWVTLNEFAGLAITDEKLATADEKEKRREAILKASSANILGRSRGVIETFAALDKQIADNIIKNRFLAFEIDLSKESDVTIKLISYLQDFIQYMNAFLEKRKVTFFFFVILSVITEDDFSRKFIPKYMPGLDTELYDFERLPKVQLTDIDRWLEILVKKKSPEFKTSFNSIKSDIIKEIFVDTSLFPKSYKQCLYDIDSRAK